MSPVPQSVIDEVYARCDIVEIISGYLHLQPAGRNFRALCPFHQEKTPSFIVSPEKQLFNCFGCGTGGNVFSFLMKHEHLSFMEALRLLAEKAGVTLSGLGGEKEASSALFELNGFAKDFFIKCLGETSKARDYLLKKRGLSPEVIEKFCLGYAPPDRDALLRKAEEEGFSERILIEGGLLIQRQDKEGYYDRFRNRIIFPIFNLAEKVVGFGGRALGDEMPLYMNSPETALYHKSDSLYGLHLSRKAIAECGKALIVEGYMDVIAVFQAGIRNVVGSLGTSLTRRQLRLIRRYAQEVVMVYDGDKAGIEATLRGLDSSLAEGFSVRLTSLPEGEDPDSFIGRHGSETFQERVSCAADLLEYKLGFLRNRYDSTTVGGKASIVREMLPTLEKVANAIEKSGYIKRLAEELSLGGRASLGEEYILTELHKLESKETRAMQPSPINIDPYPAERSLIQIMLQHSNMVDRIKAEAGEFQCSDYRKIAEVIFELHQDGRASGAGRIVNILGDDKIEALVSRLAVEAAPFEDIELAVADALRAMRNNERKRKIEALEKRIEDADEEGEEELVKRLQAECQQITQEMVSYRRGG
ncbi:MAG: DNA primase [Syntrophomonadaceae bacterium]|nr:DNA primase [Bacillota bacterium]